MKRRNPFHWVLGRMLGCLLAVAVTGCLENNNGSNLASAANGSPIQSASTAASSSYGQCANIDVASPQLPICNRCYLAVLALDCPGANVTSPSQCLDPVIRSAFTNLVNQCVAQSEIAGYTCFKNCPAGEILHATTCTCGAAALVGTTPTYGTPSSGTSTYGASIEVGGATMMAPEASATDRYGNIYLATQNGTQVDVLCQSTNGYCAGRRASTLYPVTTPDYFYTGGNLGAASIAVQSPPLAGTTDTSASAAVNVYAKDASGNALAPWCMFEPCDK